MYYLLYFFFFLLLPSVFALNITVTWDQSVNGAGAEFKPAVLEAIHFFQTYLINPIALNITVGYGEVAGIPLSSGALGESAYSGYSIPYKDLPFTTSDPTGGTGIFVLTIAQAKALGISIQTSIDGSVGFSNTVLFDYNRTDGIDSNAYDFMAVVLHEISEVLGRVTYNGINDFYSILDLFHFASNHTRMLHGVGGYFSIDNGETNLNNFNSVAGEDYGDWAIGTIDAAAASISPGILMPFTNSDMLVLHAIGWDITNYNVSSTFVSPDDNTTTHNATIFLEIVALCIVFGVIYCILKPEKHKAYTRV